MGAIAFPVRDLSKFIIKEILEMSMKLKKEAKSQLILNFKRILNEWNPPLELPRHPSNDNVDLYPEDGSIFFEALKVKDLLSLSESLNYDYLWKHDVEAVLNTSFRGFRHYLRNTDSFSGAARIIKMVLDNLESKKIIFKYHEIKIVEDD